jgi:hypothetical protein
MTDHDDRGRVSEADDPLLARLAEQVTRRLQAGERVDADDYIDRYPARAGSIRGLLSVLHELAALGRSIAGRRQARPEGDTKGRP